MFMEMIIAGFYYDNGSADLVIIGSKFASISFQISSSYQNNMSVLACSRVLLFFFFHEYPQIEYRYFIWGLVYNGYIRFSPCEH